MGHLKNEIGSVVPDTHWISYIRVATGSGPTKKPVVIQFDTGPRPAPALAGEHDNDEKKEDAKGAKPKKKKWFLRRGDVVWANHKGKGNYYQGKIDKINDDMTYAVTYDDGDYSTEPQEHIRIRNPKDCSGNHLSNYPLVAAKFVKPAKNNKAPDPSELGKSDMTRTMQYPRAKYDIDGKLKKLVDLLKLTARVLRENKIPYMLTQGALMGAYRHGRVLPWDDDLDISVPIEHHDLILSEEIAAKAKKLNVGFNNGYFPCKQAYYKTICKYVQKNKPRTGPDPDNKYDGSLGYMAHSFLLDDPDTYLDIWHIFPLTVGGHTVYSFFDGTVVYKKDDLFPTKPCVFEKETFQCPRRSRWWLESVYKDIRVPTAWDKHKCGFTKLDRKQQHFPTTSQLTHPWIPQLVEEGSKFKLHFPKEDT